MLHQRSPLSLRAGQLSGRNNKNRDGDSPFKSALDTIPNQDFLRNLHNWISPPYSSKSLEMAGVLLKAV